MIQQDHHDVEGGPAESGFFRRPKGWGQRERVSMLQHPHEMRNDDLLELSVKRKLALGEDRTLQRFLKDYQRMKWSRGDELVKSLVYYENFGAGSATQITETEHGEDSIKHDGDTFSDGVSRLLTALESYPSECLQMCTLAAEVAQQLRSRHLSFFDMVSASFGSRLERLLDTPRRSIALLVELAWHLPDYVTERLSPTRCLKYEPEPIRPPSLKVHEGNVDSSQRHDGTIALTWQYSAPQYKSDLDVYIWRQHTQLPSFEYADVFCLPQTVHSPPRIIVSLRSTRALNIFKTKRLDQANAFSSLESKVWSAASEEMLTLIAIYLLMVDDTTSFLRESMTQIQNMKLNGRQDPSASKIRYLVHLDDCQVSANDSILHSTKVLDNLRTYVRSKPVALDPGNAATFILERLDEIEKDLIYLKEKFAHTRSLISQLQRETRDHLSLTQDRRLFVLTVLAALFLPLSFVSSFFGMNITRNVKPRFEGFSMFRNQTLQGLQPDYRNSTEAILQALDTSGGDTWALSEYGLVAGPLVMIVPLSIIAGAIFRGSVRFAAQYAAYWRASIAFAAVLGLVGIYWALPYGAGWTSDPGYDDYEPYYGRYTNGSERFNFVWEQRSDAWYYNTYGPTFLAYIILNTVILGLFALWRLWLAFTRKYGRRVWTAFAVIVTVSLVLDLEVVPFWLSPDPIMLAPYLFLLWIWKGRDVRDWYQERKKRAMRWSLHNSRTRIRQSSEKILPWKDFDVAGWYHTTTVKLWRPMRRTNGPRLQKWWKVERRAEI